MRKPLKVLVAVTLVAVLTGSVNAHSYMKKPMQKRYHLKLVSCNACHVKGEEKEVVNPFGETIEKLLEDTTIPQRVEACKEADEETKKQIEKALAEEFGVLLKRLDEIKTPSGKPYGQALRDGDIAGAKPRKAASSDDDQEDTEEDEDDDQEDDEKADG